jgi:hypothetical protein
MAGRVGQQREFIGRAQAIKQRGLFGEGLDAKRGHAGGFRRVHQDQIERRAVFIRRQRQRGPGRPGLEAQRAGGIHPVGRQKRQHAFA